MFQVTEYATNYPDLVIIRCTLYQKRREQNYICSPGVEKWSSFPDKIPYSTQGKQKIRENLLGHFYKVTVMWVKAWVLLHSASQQAFRKVVPQKM